MNWARAECNIESDWAEMGVDKKVQAICIYAQKDKKALSLFNMKIRGTDGRISIFQIMSCEDESAVYILCTCIRYHGSCRL